MHKTLTRIVLTLSLLTLCSCGFSVQAEGAPAGKGREGGDPRLRRASDPVPAVPAATQALETELAQPRGGKPGMVDLYVREGDERIAMVRSRGLDPHLSKPKSSLTPKIEVVEQPGGYNMVYTFTNRTSAAKPLGRLVVGVITLGRSIRWLDHNRKCALKRGRWASFSAQGRLYPGTLYSPVSVLMNDQYAVGVSLLHDFTETSHDVRVWTTRVAGGFAVGEEGPGWAVWFDLSNTGDGAPGTRPQYPALLEPGQTRTYTVAVRVASAAGQDDPHGEQAWLAALEPYRAFFQERFGGVTYERSGTPLHGYAVANISASRDRNPMAFRGGNDRPDLVGFGPKVREWKRRDGWSGIVLWAPSGLYREQTKWNFPFFFTSRWLSKPTTATALDGEVGLPAIPRAGKRLGLWWGRALLVPDKWEPETLDPLDPENPEHRAKAFAELDLAVRSGATLVGLDNFSHDIVPAWTQFEWLNVLRARAPEIMFVVEPAGCDVLHTRAGSFFRAIRSSDPDDYISVEHPHYLADFLVPGYESWGLLRYGELRRHGQAAHPTPARVTSDTREIARNGYTPVMFTHQPLRDDGIVAAETWRNTVPKSVRKRSER
ncbi:MAG: hypothetical protein AAGG07_07000 [Planctomycetota bacterium]